MKTESTVKFVIRLAVTLLIITAVVAAALAGVNSVTAPIIAAANEKKTQEAVEAVLPGGGEIVDFTASSDIVSEVYKGENGVAVKVAPGGFGGAIEMMVGVDNEGKVLVSLSLSTRKLPAWVLWLRPRALPVRISGVALWVCPAK